ncbi:MAG: alpha/beta hydrolase [Desulfobacterales bacterium]|nr:alpha/beta hydrolase [Desulfobacterales bacterium]MBF0398620.1 alpha/beta hydrolase [Desulfobacterales bacterium]
MEYIPFWQDKVVQKTIISRDGVPISYQSLGAGTDRVIVLANGLGGRLYVWEPLIEKMYPEYRIITWDYRGLFESEVHSKIRRLSITNHAEDLATILDKEEIKNAVIIGWSMGVQVSLEFAYLFPEKAKKLVLINGTYGHALSTGFQPLVRIPWLNRYLHELIDLVKNTPIFLYLLEQQKNLKPLIWPVGIAYSYLRGNGKIKYAINQYVSDVLSTDISNYLRLFQELDAHSAYHYLREIKQPTLVIWGDLDLLTPAYQSKEIVRKMRNAKYVRFLLGTHFVLLEYPKEVSKHVADFLR